MLRCNIVRERTAFNLLHPKYFLYHEDGNKFLMSARKRKKSKSSNYLLSLEKDDLTRASKNYFGKLRANFLGTEFAMFDNGDNPSAPQTGAPRQQYGCVFYDTNILGTKGPRKVTVALPGIGLDGKHMNFGEDQGNSIVDKFKNGEWKNLLIYKNKSPSWNESMLFVKPNLLTLCTIRILSLIHI